MLSISLFIICLVGAHGAYQCADYVGTDCKRCSGPHMYCKDNQCRCKWGSCAYKGMCKTHSECVKKVNGACKLFPCKASRGWTDCVKGECRCQWDACNRQGSCTKSCEYRVAATVKEGGTCTFMGCDASRHANCERPGNDAYWGFHSYRCVCPKDKCASNGACYPTGWIDEPTEYANITAVETIRPWYPENQVRAFELALPSANDPVALVAFSLFACLVGAGLALRRWAKLRNIDMPEMVLG